MWTLLVSCLLVTPGLALAQPTAAEVPTPAAPGPAGTPSPSVQPPVISPPLSAAPVSAPQPVSAVPPVPTATVPGPGEHRHLGLFVHVDLGGAYLRTTGSKGGSTFAGQGGALGFALAVGWAPDDEWALALEIWSWKALSPSGLGPDTSVELQALGLNVTRYIVPVDLFATLVISGTRLAITDSADYLEYGSSDIGFGFKVLLGKEWRVSSWLGLGVAGELFLSVNHDGGQTLRTIGGGLVVSCTVR